MSNNTKTGWELNEFCSELTTCCTNLTYFAIIYICQSISRILKMKANLVTILRCRSLFIKTKFAVNYATNDLTTSSAETGKRPTINLFLDMFTLEN